MNLQLALTVLHLKASDAYSYSKCFAFLHLFSNLSLLLSFYPSLGPVTLRPSCPLCHSDCVSFLPSPLSSCYFSPFLFCPCLFLSPYRTQNVSSNGNPGYESLPLSDRQSPPPSVSSSVPMTPSKSFIYSYLSKLIGTDQNYVASFLFVALIRPKNYS